MLSITLARLLQLLCSAAVLALSILAIQWQWVHNTPPETSYATFVGVWGCIFSIVGLIAIRGEVLSRIVTLPLDTLTAIFFLAGGITYAVALRGINCDDPDNVDTWGNTLISGGCVYNYYNDGRYACGYESQAFEPQATSRCRQVEANCAVMFLGFIVTLFCMSLSGRHVSAKENP